MANREAENRPECESQRKGEKKRNDGEEAEGEIIRVN